MTLAGVLHALVSSLAAIPPAEWAAVVLALAYLLLALRQDPWCWACAIASSAIYLALFSQGGLVMQAVLQVFYIFMGAYGWWAWRGGSAAVPGSALPVSCWDAARHAGAVTCVLVATLVSGWIVARSRGGLVSYADAFVAWTSVLATWMVARKVLENWLYWIVVDAVAAALYWSQGFHATSVLFVLYVVIAARAYFAWRTDYLRAGTNPAGPTHA